MIKNITTLLILSLLTVSSFWQTTYALVKKTTKPVTSNVKTSVPTSTPVTPAVQPVPPVLSNVSEKIKEDDIQLVLLRTYVNYWDQVNSMAYTAWQTETIFTCGDFVFTWNNYLLPQYEALKVYAQKKKADYVLFRMIKDYETFQKYLTALRPQCTVSLKDPTQTKLPTLDKKLSSMYTKYIMNDFGNYSQIITGFFASYGLNRSQCAAFAQEDWKYDFKPKIAQLQWIAQELWLEDEAMLLKNYKESIEWFYKLRCNTTLE